MRRYAVYDPSGYPVAIRYFRTQAIWEISKRTDNIGRPDMFGHFTIKRINKLTWYWYTYWYCLKLG